jgi:hypothetical protein
LLRELRTKDRGEFYPAQRFQAVFEAYAQPALRAVTEPRRRKLLFIYECIAREANDPNLIRDRGMDVMYRL